MREERQNSAVLEDSLESMEADTMASLCSQVRGPVPIRGHFSFLRIDIFPMSDGDGPDAGSFQPRSRRHANDDSHSIKPLCTRDKTKSSYCQHVLFLVRPEMAVCLVCIDIFLVNVLSTLQCNSDSHNSHSPSPQQSR